MTPRGARWGPRIQTLGPELVRLGCAQGVESNSVEQRGRGTKRRIQGGGGDGFYRCVCWGMGVWRVACGVWRVALGLEVWMMGMWLHLCAMADRTCIRRFVWAPGPALPRVRVDSCKGNCNRSRDVSEDEFEC
jgi:hypothetical protein